MSSTSETPLKFSEWTSYLEKLEEARKAIVPEGYIAARDTLNAEYDSYSECYNSGTLPQEECADTYLKHQYNLPIFNRYSGGGAVDNIFASIDGEENSLDYVVQHIFDQDGVPLYVNFNDYKNVVKSGNYPIGLYQDAESGEVYVGVNKSSLLKEGIDNYIILIDKPDTKGCCLMTSVDTTLPYTFDLQGTDYVKTGTSAGWFEDCVWYKAKSVAYPLFRDDTRLDLLGLVKNFSGTVDDKYSTVRRNIDLVAPIFSLQPDFAAQITSLFNDDEEEKKGCQKDLIVIKKKQIVSGATVYTLKGVAAHIGNSWVATIGPDMRLWLWAWKIIKIIFQVLVPCYSFEQHGGSKSVVTQNCLPIKFRCTGAIRKKYDTFVGSRSGDALPLGFCLGNCVQLSTTEVGGDPYCDDLQCGESQTSKDETCTYLTNEECPYCACGEQTEAWVSRICQIPTEQRCTINKSTLWFPKYITVSNNDALCNTLKNGHKTTETLYETRAKTVFDHTDYESQPGAICTAPCSHSNIYEYVKTKLERETNLAFLNSTIVDRIETPNIFNVISANTKGLDGEENEWIKHICVGSAMKLIKTATIIWDCIKGNFIGRSLLTDGKEDSELLLNLGCANVTYWDPTSQSEKTAMVIYNFQDKKVTNACSCYGKEDPCEETLLSDTSECGIVNVYDPSKTNVILKFNFSN